MVIAYSAAPTVSARCLPESHQTTCGASRPPSTRSRRPADLATAGRHRGRSQPVALLSAQLTCFTGFERLNGFKNYFLGQRLQRRTAEDCYSALAQALPPWRRIFQRRRWGGGTKHRQTCWHCCQLSQLNSLRARPELPPSGTANAVPPPPSISSRVARTPTLLSTLLLLFLTLFVPSRCEANQAGSSPSD